MALEAARALIEVVAGVIPGTPMPELTKRWGYTSSDYEKDMKTPEGQETIFTARLKEAHLHAMLLSDPNRVNWVRVDWIWV